MTSLPSCTFTSPYQPPSAKLTCQITLLHPPTTFFNPKHTHPPSPSKKPPAIFDYRYTEDTRSHTHRVAKKTKKKKKKKKEIHERKRHPGRASERRRPWNSGATLMYRAINHGSWASERARRESGWATRRANGWIWKRCVSAANASTQGLHVFAPLAR